MRPVLRKARQINLRAAPRQSLERTISACANRNAPQNRRGSINGGYPDAGAIGRVSLLGASASEYMLVLGWDPRRSPAQGTRAAVAYSSQFVDRLVLRHLVPDRIADGRPLLRAAALHALPGAAIAMNTWCFTVCVLRRIGLLRGPARHAARLDPIVPCHSSHTILRRLDCQSATQPHAIRVWMSIRSAFNVSRLLRFRNTKRSHSYVTPVAVPGV